MHFIENVTYLNIKLVSQYTGLSHNTIHSAAKSGSFPSPVHFDSDEVGLSSEIANWLESQPLSPSTFEGGKAA